MHWTWSKHFYAVSGIAAIVGLAIGIVFLAGGKAETQIISLSHSPDTVVINPYQDTDKDRLIDTEESAVHYTDPLKADTDADGLSDYEEIKIYHSNPLLFDTNNNGYSDGLDVAHGFSPTHNGRILFEDADTDGDGLSDSIELKLGLNLGNPDTDNDGALDKDEVMSGANPSVFGDDRTGIERHVEINLTIQELYFFINNIKIGTMPVSTGLPRTPTPVGEFEIFRKVPLARYVSTRPGDEYDLPNVKWNLEFKKSYFLHTAYWHNQFGNRPMSHGCVNMRLADAEKIYQFLDKGDKVIIYGKTPIGKVKKEE